MSNRNLEHAAPLIFSTRLPSRRPLSASIVEFLRTGFRAIAAWHNRRREHEKLFKYLASDHRAAADIGYPHLLP